MNTMLAIALIKRDMLLQPRAELHQDWIEDYALDMTSGAVMPPVIVYRDTDGRHWLADGFHRTYAAEAAGLAEILADVREGTRDDALLHSLSANAEHGHRRTNEDKRRAVDIALGHPQWRSWPDEKIALHCAVHRTTVLRRREELSSALHKIPRSPVVRTVTRNGTTYEMDTGAIGRQRTGEEWIEWPAPQPTFDWNAARIRQAAMDPIRALANQPPPEEVIAAWVKTMGYGEPNETFERAIAWLTEFARLYRAAEPARWAEVMRKGEGLNAAE